MRLAPRVTRQRGPDVVLSRRPRRRAPPEVVVERPAQDDESGLDEVVHEGRVGGPVGLLLQRPRRVPLRASAAEHDVEHRHTGVLSGRDPSQTRIWARSFATSREQLRPASGARRGTCHSTGSPCGAEALYGLRHEGRRGDHPDATRQCGRPGRRAGEGRVHRRLDGRDGARPVPAAAAGRRAHGDHRARHGDRRRLRPQPDDAGAHRVGPAGVLQGPVHPRARQPDQAAHHEALLDAVEPPGRPHAGADPGHPGDLGLVAARHTTAVPWRVLHAHADDAVLHAPRHRISTASASRRSSSPASGS